MEAIWEQRSGNERELRRLSAYSAPSTIMVLCCLSNLGEHVDANVYLAEKGRIDLTRFAATSRNGPWTLPALL